MDFSPSRFFETTLALITALGIVEGIKLFILSFFEDIVDKRRWKINERRELRDKLLNILSRAQSVKWKIPPTQEEAAIITKARNILYKKWTFERIYCAITGSWRFWRPGMHLKLEMYLDAWRTHAHKFEQYKKNNKDFSNEQSWFYQNVYLTHRELVENIKSLS